MDIAFPVNTKKSKYAIKKLKEELELRKLNCEWQEDFEGVFGLMKQNNSEDKNLNGNWFHRTELNYGAVQLPKSTKELFVVTKIRHLNFFESLIQANIRKEAENIPSAAFEFCDVKKPFEEETENSCGAI